MLEKQHNQLACGLQEMYRRLRKASIWEGEPLDESTGRPLTHDILAALNFLVPQEDGSHADFIEQPRSSLVLQGPNDDDDDDLEKTPTASSQELSQPTLHDRAVFFDSDPPPRSVSSRSSSKAISPTTPVPDQLLGQPGLQPNVGPFPVKQSLAAVSLPLPPYALWDDLLYNYDVSQAPLYDSSLENTNCHFESPPILQPLITQVPGLSQDISSHKRTALAPPPSLCHNWLDNGVTFDSSDFMSEFDQLSPQQTTDVNLPRPEKAGSLSWFGSVFSHFSIHSPSVNALGSTPYR